MQETMYTYIRKQETVLPDIFTKRSAIADSFLAVFGQAHFRKIIFVASGSSYHAAVSSRYLLENLLNIEVQVIHPYPFTYYEEQLGKDTLVIAISQTGKSTLTMEAVKKAEKLGLANMALTADRKSPLAQLFAHPIIIPCGIEKVVYVTLGYSSTILTLQLMAVEAAYRLQKIEAQTYQALLADIDRMLSNLGSIITAADEWYDRNKANFIQSQRIMVVGYGPNFGTALEGGLKVSETVRCAANGYDVEEFMHGPHLELHKNSSVILIEAKGIGEQRSAQLKSFLQTVTPYTYSISYRENKADPCHLHIPTIDNENVSPLHFVIPMQVLAHHLSTDRGININEEPFPHFNQYVHSKTE